MISGARYHRVATYHQCLHKIQRDFHRFSYLHIRLTRLYDRMMDQRYVLDQNRISSNHNLCLARDSMVLSLDEEHLRNEYTSNRVKFDKESNKYVLSLKNKKLFPSWSISFNLLT